MHDDSTLDERFGGVLAPDAMLPSQFFAALRRNAGNQLCEARGVAWFYSLLGRYSGNGRHDEAYFLSATFFASDKDAIEGRNRFTGDFGSTLRALRSKSGAAASDVSPLDRRLNILLDADFDPAFGGELAFRLRQMTRLVISKKDPAVRICWPQLLRDVKLWNSGRKAVQKRWARSYYAPALESPEDSQSEPIE
jgi:CRISPR system Cascade subunit CasB